MYRNRKFDWEDKALLQSYVDQCYTVSDVLRMIGLRVVGGNHKTFLKWQNIHGIVTSHFRVGFETANKKVTKLADEVLIEGSKVSQACLRNHVKREETIPYKCGVCDNPGIWYGLPLVLQLDHINGVNGDNRPLNLRWLCPNCHSQTVTWAGRNNLGSKNIE